MFFIYVPIISVSLYFLATKCVPVAVSRELSRTASYMIIIVAFTVAKVARCMMALRLAYMWDKRTRLVRPLVYVLDTLLKINKEQVLLDTSSGHESIIIRRAIATVSGRDYDVTRVLKDMWTYGDGLRIDVPTNVVLECLNLEGRDHDADVVMRIRYSGHSNIPKRYSSETFSVRNECILSRVYLFPPYASSDEIKRGLGVARIIRANFVEDNGKMLYGQESKQSSGLRRNFYVDVEDDPCLAKKVVTFFDPSARYQEQKQIVVTRSKSNSKIFCNSQVPP
ncbi:unnamed protein product [Sphacelaria rigidula]